MASIYDTQDEFTADLAAKLIAGATDTVGVNQDAYRVILKSLANAYQAALDHYQAALDQDEETAALDQDEDAGALGWTAPPVGTIHSTDMERCVRTLEWEPRGGTFAGWLAHGYTGFAQQTFERDEIARWLGAVALDSAYPFSEPQVSRDECAAPEERQQETAPEELQQETAPEELQQEAATSSTPAIAEIPAAASQRNHPAPLAGGSSIRRNLRYPGYRRPLERFVERQVAAGKGIPNAREFIEDVAANPAQYPGLRAMSDGIKFSTHPGKNKEADLRAIAAAIKRLPVKSNAIVTVDTTR